MLKISEKPDLRDCSTMAVDAVADWLVEWDNPGDLHRLFTDPAYAGITDGPVIPVGSGSNLLFVSNPLRATLLRCSSSAVTEVSSDGDTVMLKADAGTVLDDLVAMTAERGLWGLENLSLIPGTAGAAAVQNPGAYGQEFGDAVVRVECYDRKTDSMTAFTRSEMDYGYRMSALKHPAMRGRMTVTAVTVALSAAGQPRLSYGRLDQTVRTSGAPLTPAGMRRIVSEIRQSKLPDPALMPSCGSFFKNPVVDAALRDRVLALAAEAGIEASAVPVYEVPSADGAPSHYKLSAAWLIDRSGWKGCVRGNVALWPQQPLVIVNPDGLATGHEIAAFAADISADVEAKWGIRLIPEVEYL